MNQRNTPKCTNNNKEIDNVKCWYFTNTNTASENIVKLNYNIGTDTYTEDTEDDIIFVGNFIKSWKK